MEQIENLNEQGQIIIKEMVEKMFLFLDMELPRITEYSHITMCLNVLICTLASVGVNYVKDIPSQREFVRQVKITLEANFQANNKRK